MKRILFLLSVVAFVMAISIFTVPSTSHALVLNNVTVTVGNITRCITGCASNIWSSAAGTNITPGGPISAVVLTQTAGFNFDTSDANAQGHCDATSPCTTTLNINGVAIPLTGGQANQLANNNTDPGGAAHNEASNWNGAVFNGGQGNFIVWFGYADTAHTDACADTTGQVPNNCLPDNPWQGSPNTLFVGNATTTAPGAGCDRPGITSCFDAGAIRIEVVQGPEPSSMLLLGAGLIGLAAWGKKRKQS
jgi:hypothetical protein